MRRYGWFGVLMAVLVVVSPQVFAQDAPPAGNGGGFVDIEGNTHEENIRFIVNRGVTVGCDLEGPRYCPDDPVTRAEMAAFLTRALRLDASSPFLGVYADVAEGTWYAPFVEALGAYGLTDTQVSGDYRPGDAMLRSEMAIFLQKAFRLPLPTETSESFGDIPADAAYARAADAVLEAGITRGCAVDALLFCPEDTVKRDTMASFLARAIQGGELRQALAFAPDRETLTSVGAGEDTWDVWICDNTPVEEDVVDYLNRVIGTYYEWLSGGDYQIRFQYGKDPSPSVTQVLDNCDNQKFAYSFPEGANIFIGGNLGGLGNAAGAGGGWLNPYTNHYDRNVWADKGGVYDNVLYAHEMGHTFGWPHNLARKSSDPLHTGMDIMASRDRLVGTNAHNLFHVGWLDPDQVKVHSTGTATYVIGPPHANTGVGLVMVPLSPDRLISLGARVRENHDRNITTQGVELYEIGFCDYGLGCKKVLLPPGTRGKEAVVLGVGDSWTATVVTTLTGGRPLPVDIDVSVTDQQNGSYTVVVNTTPVKAELSTIGVGLAGVCGLLTDGTVSCWDWWGGDRPPEHQFASLGVGYRVCGTGTGGAIECWGPSNYGTPAPEGQFNAVSLSGYHACGHRTDGTVACWGADNKRQPITETPSGEFLSVSAGWAHACGIRAGRTVECWGSNDAGESTPPSEELMSVSAGGFFSCGIRPDNTVACWGNNHNGKATAPEGAFAQVEAGWAHACGLRVDGAVVCWGNNGYGESASPQGVFTTIAVGNARTCGLRPDHTTVECWGRNRLEK